MSGACSMAIHVILNELEQEVEIENVRMLEGQKHSAEFLKVSPRGQVPVLVEKDGNSIREGAAIMIYLLDKYNSPMLPKNGKDRAKALEWLMFANATMHPIYGRIFFAMRNNFEQSDKDQIFKITAEQINKLWAEVDEQLAKTKFLCGDQISAADIASICQEAGMKAVRKNRYVITQQDFDKAYKTVVKRTQKDFNLYKLL